MSARSLAHPHNQKEMRARVILFIIGILIFLMGVMPLLSNLIPGASKFIGSMPQAGTIVYQIILTLIGIISVGYALKREEIKVRRR
jgi:hypothetical protein